MSTPSAVKSTTAGAGRGTRCEEDSPNFGWDRLPIVHYVRQQAFNEIDSIEKFVSVRKRRGHASSSRGQFR